MKAGVLTISDTCSAGTAKDTSGPLLASLLVEAGWSVEAAATVPDSTQEIRRALITWADSLCLDLVVTTGGTGFAPRDLTPEATLGVLDREARGLVHAMTQGSLAVTPLAALSRAVAGIRGATVIINMPGSHKAVRECWGFVGSTLGHACHLLRGENTKVVSTHKTLQEEGAPSRTPAPAFSHTCPHNVAGTPNSNRGEGVAGRARVSEWPMVSVAEAQAMVVAECRALLTPQGVLGTQEVAYTEALGRILCQEVRAKEPLPPFKASIKDGYAVVASDGPGVRRVRGEASAGCSPDMAALSPGEVVRINTGAPLPPGADAVVMVEETRLVSSTQDGREESEVEILAKEVRPGQDVRPVGSDIAEGEVVLVPGTSLAPPEVGLLAAVGQVEVGVAVLPRVGVLSTGNEVQAPGSPLGQGHIRDSNKTTLLSLLATGGFQGLDLGIARDEEGVLGDSLEAALAHCDLLITTGGVSMGDRDLLRQVLVSRLGAKVHFARVNMKPGKPTTLATLELKGAKKVVLGLPGNPVSATVTAHLYVLPACRVLAGSKTPFQGLLKAKLYNSAPLRLDPRPEYLRVHLTFPPGCSVAQAQPTGNQISSRLGSMAKANGLLILPMKSEQMQQAEEGLECDTILIGPLLVA